MDQLQDLSVPCLVNECWICYDSLWEKWAYSFQKYKSSYHYHIIPKGSAVLYNSTCCSNTMGFSLNYFYISRGQGIQIEKYVISEFKNSGNYRSVNA